MNYIACHGYLKMLTIGVQNSQHMLMLPEKYCLTWLSTVAYKCCLNAHKIVACVQKKCLENCYLEV